MPLKPEELDKLNALFEKTNETMNSLHLTMVDLSSYLKANSRLVDDAGPQIISELQIAIKTTIEILNAILGES